jgi:hypothetical protein
MKKSETKWAKEAVALEKEQRLMSQFKSKNSGTDKEKDKEREREKERDNSETGSVGSDKHYPNPFTKKGAGYGSKVKSDMHKGEREWDHFVCYSLGDVLYDFNCDVSCHVMSCHVMSCHVMSCHVT